MANTRAVIDIDINTSPAAAGLKNLQSQINGFTSALNKANAEQGLAAKGITRQLSDLANTSKFFTAETVRMQTSAAQLDNTLKKGQVTLGQFFSSKFRKDGLAAAQVLSLANARASALRTQFIATGAAANGMREAIAIRPMQAFNDAAAVSAQKLIIQRAMLQQATTSMINFGKNTQWAGRQLMVGFTVPLTIFGAAAGKTFRELEREAVNFKKVYGDAFTPPEEMEANLKAVQELAKEYTKYGIAVKDTVGLAAEAAAAGAQNKDLLDATTQATRLATLGQMEQNEALETTISLQNAFKLSGDDLAKSINFLNMVENQTVVTLQDLSAAIPRVAPVIKGLGGSVEDLAAMLAAMQEGGVSAEQGANALKSGLASLINPTDKAVEKLEGMGIALNTIIQMNRGDLMGTVQSFADALDSLDKFSRQQALEQVFGKFQYARLGALFDNINKDGTQASRVLDMVGMSAEEMAASAEKELSAIEQATGTKFTAAMEKLQLAIAPIGEIFTKMAIPVLNFLTRIAEAFNNLPDFAKNFIGFSTVIVGLVIPAGTMFLGLLMNLIGTLTKFGHILGVSLKGFTSGGFKGAINAVSQALSYMSLEEIDASLAAQQLAGSTEAVNAALLEQVSMAESSTAAIMGLAGAYDLLVQNMRESMLVGGLPMAVPGQAGLRAGRSGLLYKPLPIVARNKGGSIPYMSTGSTVPGTGNTDTVPAMLTPGEFVVNKQATQQNMGLLHAINNGDVQYRNKGGGIAKLGQQYYGPRRPNPYAISAQQARARLEEFESSRPAIAQTFGLPFGGTPRSTSAFGTIRTTQVSSSRRSRDIFDAVTGRNTKAARMLRAAESLGISKDEMGLKQVGNFVLAMSPSSNVKMANGNLAKQRLLAELDNPGAFDPLSQQLEKYFGKSLNDKLFDEIYRQQIALLPEYGITNARFEKASRNALRIYLDRSGFDRESRKAFLKDVLSPDSVRGNLTRDRIRQALRARGITPNENGGDIKAIVNGEEFNFGDLAGRTITRLGRPQGITRYDDLDVAEGLERVHANMGGMIPGVQYFFGGGIPQAVRSFAGLFSTRTGLPGVARGRAKLNERFLRASSIMGLSRKTSGINLEGSLTGAGKRGSFIEGLSLQRGHVAKALREGDYSYHPALMFWQSKKANRKLVSSGVTGKELVDDFLTIESSGLHPASLMMVGGEELGLSGAQLRKIKSAYGKIIRGLKSKKNSSRIFKDEDFTSYTEEILKRTLDKETFDALYNVGTIRYGGKSIATSSFDDFITISGITRNKGGMIPGIPGYMAGARINPLFKEMERRRASVAVAKGKTIDDIIFARGSDKKLNASAFDLLTLLRHNPNLTRKELERIQKYHGKRIRNGVFGRFDPQFGVRFRDSDSPQWKDIARLLEEKGFPVIQKRNQGGKIFESRSKTIVPGVGNTDTVPAMLTPGEFVINKKATQSNKALLEAINNGTLRGYKLGGIFSEPDGYYVEGKSNFYGPMSKKQAMKRSKQLTSARARRGMVSRTRTPGAMRGGGGMGMMGGKAMGLSMLGGTAMMGGMMIPGVAENQVASTAMMGGGMLLSMAPMLAGMGPAGIAIAAVAAAATVAGVAIYKLRDAIDTASRKAAEFGSNLGGAANRMEKISAATGYQFARDRSPLESFKFTQQEIEGASQFGEYFESETGQKFVEDLQKLDPQARYEEVRSAIAMAIADGMDKETAKAYGDAVAFYTNDALLKARIGRDIRSGEFVKGSTAAIAEIDKRVSSAQERLPELVEAGGMSRSYLSDILGTEGMTNIIGESALTTIPFLRGIHESIDDMVDEQGNFNFSISAIANNMNPVAMLRTFGETFFPGQGGEGNVVSNIKALGENAESVAAHLGSSIQILKELENAEALLMEERKNGIISTQQYQDRLSKLQSLEKQQYQKMDEAIKAASDEGFTKQAISNQLILAGFEGDLAKTIADTTSATAVAQKMFNEDFNDLSEEQKNVVTSVISRTLTGITPENAQEKIAEIENTYVAIAQQLLNAAKEGLTLTPQELDTAVLTQQVRNFVESAFEGVDLGGRKGRSAARIKEQATQNIMSVDTLGLQRADITGALASFVDREFALNIASSKQKLDEFVPLIKELQQFPGINVEIITKTESGRDPQDVAKDIRETLDDISKLKFKGIRKEIVEALPAAEEYINLARQAGISFDDIPGALKEAATQADALSKALDPKRTGILKQVKVGIITELFGNQYGDPAALTSAINAVFPDGVDPLYIPLILQLQNPEVLQLISGGYGAQVLNALKQGKTSIELGMGKTPDQLAREGGGTVFDLAPVDMTKTPPFTGEKPTGSSGGGGGQKSLLEQLQEQFKSLRDIYKSMKKFINSETGAFKSIAAGPFGPEFIEFLKSQGEEGLKILNGSLDKMKKAYKEFRKIQMQEATNFAQTLPANLIRERQRLAKEEKFRGTLEEAGFNQEQQDTFIEEIGGGAGIENYYNLIKKDRKDLSKNELNFINSINSAIKKGGPAAEKLFTTLSNNEINQNLKDMNKETDMLVRLLQMGYTREEADSLMQLGVNASTSEEQIRNLNLELQNLAARSADINELEMNLSSIQGQIISNNQRISELKAEIAIEEQLSDEQKLLETYEKENDLISRRIELRQRDLEPIDQAIEKIEEEKAKIEEAYSIQLKALDDVARKEDNLARIREGRLDVASALSRGDVGAAAQAAIEMQRRFAETQQDQARYALEERRQQELDAAEERINEKKEQRKVIEDDIKKLQLEQRDIQDKIYNTQKFINDETVRLQNEYGVATTNLEILKNELFQATQQQTLLANEAKRTADELERARAVQNSPLAKSNTGTSNSELRGVNSAGAFELDYQNMDPGLFAGLPDFSNMDLSGLDLNINWGTYAMGGKVNYKGSREPAPGMMYGGKMKKYAMGSFVPGRGMTDKVPAMLTPGEFVVRKSVASQYGPLLQAMNSDIFPGIRGIANDPVFYAPSVTANSLIAPISNLTVPMDNRSMQYNYSISVNAKTDADANEIANVVINKIKRIDDRQVKGVRL